MPIQEKLLIQELANEIQDLLIQCCEYNNNTGLSLIFKTAQEIHPLLAEPSSADKLAKIWMDGYYVGKNWSLIKNATRRALENLKDKEIPNPSNPQELVTFSVKNIIVSPHLVIHHIPPSLTNLENLEEFICCGNDHLKTLETSATQLANFALCKNLTSVEACHVSKIFICNCENLEEIKVSETAEIINDEMSLKNVRVIRVSTEELNRLNAKQPSTTIEPEEYYLSNNQGMEPLQPN